MQQIISGKKGSNRVALFCTAGVLIGLFSHLYEKDTFFIKNNKGYKIYYKGRFIGNCKSLETFQGYRVYKNDKEAKENEEIK